MAFIFVDFNLKTELKNWKNLLSENSLLKFSQDFKNYRKFFFKKVQI
jgi:hypothetical protein